MHFRGPSHKRSASTSGVSRGGQGGELGGGILEGREKQGKREGRGKRGGKEKERQGKKDKENKEEKREIVKGEE